MIIGVELLCDKPTCIVKGPVLTHAFVVTTDDEDFPVIGAMCPTCNELLQHVFVLRRQADHIWKEQPEK